MLWVCLGIPMVLMPATGQAQGPDPAPRSHGPRPDPAPSASAQAPVTPPPASSAPPRTPAPTQAVPAAPRASAPTSRRVVRQAPAPRATRPAPRATAPRRSRRPRTTQRRSKPDEPGPAAALSRPLLRRRHAQESFPGGESRAVADLAPAGATSADVRLWLQLGMLFFLLYVAFLFVWFWATRRLRADGTRPDLTVTARRLRGWWSERIVGFGSAQAPASRDTFTPSGSHAQWTCEIAWQPGQMRFQAVISPNSAPKARVVGDAKSLRWPKRVHKPSPRELESAMGSLAASIAAAGWEPVQPRGPWSERRFVWRQEGEQPTGFDLVGGEPIAATEPVDRAAGPAHSPDPSPPRAGPERAPGARIATPCCAPWPSTRADDGRVGGGQWRETELTPAAPTDAHGPRGTGEDHSPRRQDRLRPHTNGCAAR